MARMMAKGMGKTGAYDGGSKKAGITINRAGKSKGMKKAKEKSSRKSSGGCQKY